MTAVSPTLRSALAQATAQFAASPHLRADAHRDALVLLLHATGLTRATLYADPDRALAPDQLNAYESLIARRLTHEPIQYITGQQEFYGLALHVTPAVLIPRPETEILVESVLAELTKPTPNTDAVILSEATGGSGVEGPRYSSSGPSNSKLSATTPLHILDVGTGSGAIAIALAHHLPHAHVTATDISPAALEVASANAARHPLTSRITFLQSDLLDQVNEQSALTREARPGRYEVLVSNPPYVSTADAPTLHPQVRDHEPATALFAGPDGLSIYRRLIPQARAALKPNGLLALEIGHDQRDAVTALLAGWRSVRFVNDLQQIPRVVLAHKP